MRSVPASARRPAERRDRRRKRTATCVGAEAASSPRACPPRRPRRHPPRTDPRGSPTYLSRRGTICDQPRPAHLAEIAPPSPVGERTDRRTELAAGVGDDCRGGYEELDVGVAQQSLDPSSRPRALKVPLGASTERHNRTTTRERRRRAPIGISGGFGCQAGRSQTDASATRALSICMSTRLGHLPAGCSGMTVAMLRARRPPVRLLSLLAQVPERVRCL